MYDRVRITVAHELAGTPLVALLEACTMCCHTVGRVAISLSRYCIGNGRVDVHSRNQRTCHCHPAVQGQPDRQCACLVGSVAEWWHLSLGVHCLRSDSLVSLMVVIVSRTWRKDNKKTDDTHCASFELAEERHFTVPPAMRTSNLGQARPRSRSSGKQLTDVSTAVLIQECRPKLNGPGLS